VSGRVICFVLIGPLLLQIGCSKTASTFWPVPHQDPDPSLPCDVKVTLKSEIALHGKHFVFPGRVKTIAWQTNEISGKLVALNDEMASIQIRNKDFEVPIEDIEEIEITRIDRTRACLLQGGCILGGAVASVFVFAMLYGAFLASTQH